MCLLDTIHGHKDLINLDAKARVDLCEEIRDFLISKVSQTGGHLASNLGVVELTVAIETVFNTEKDRLVFDVGHQSYVHKLLTDRQADFCGLRQFGGMAGFPKPSESIADSFVAGHASSSVSIALGMARARKLNNENYDVIALIGDGSATGGMAYEGLNDAAVSGEPMIIVLNDNEMSIDSNVGGMAYHLSKLRTKERYLGMKENYKKAVSKIPGGGFLFRFSRSLKDRIRRMLLPTTIFESMGFAYLGPVNGHDTEHLIMLLQKAKAMNKPVVLHVITQKGRGYLPAEQNPQLFHGIGKFDPKSGSLIKKAEDTFSGRFGKTLCNIALQENNLCAITAAMPSGTGLMPFKEKFPERLFDVGIAEEHAVSMAGGLAKQGVTPVVALYSTFLQRAYDMIIQDVCMLGLHVVFAVDRAGLVGEDGETHHGVFDVGFLRHAPGMTVLCPASLLEQEKMLSWAILHHNGPVAIRYPRGSDGRYKESAWSNSVETSAVCLADGNDAAIICYGTMVNNVLDAVEILRQRGIHAKVIQLMCVCPMPLESISEHLKGISNIYIVEEVMSGCGIYEELASALSNSKVNRIDLGDTFIPHGSIEQLYSAYGLDAVSVANTIQEALK